MTTTTTRRTSTTSSLPAAELASILDNYGNNGGNGNGYSYAIPHGAVMNDGSSSSNYAAPASQRSVDSGFGGDFASMASPSSSHHLAYAYGGESSAQPQLQYISPASSPQSTEICASHVSEGATNVNRIPPASSSSSSSSSPYDDPYERYPSYEETGPSITRGGAVADHVSAVGAPLGAHRDSSAADPDLSVIVDQVLDSIDAQFPASSSTSWGAAAASSESRAASQTSKIDATARLNEEDDDASMGKRRNNDPLHEVTRDCDGTQLCHRCANLVREGSDACDLCGMTLLLPAATILTSIAMQPEPEIVAQEGEDGDGAAQKQQQR